MPGMQPEMSAPRDGVHLDKARWKLMRQDEDGFVHAWQVELVSKRKDACDVFLSIQYLDEDGFELDSSLEEVHLEPGTVVAVTGRSFGLDSAASGVRILLKSVSTE